MSTLASRRRRSVDFWPGFVDALSSLLMVLIFVLMIFTVGQFVLSDALSGRDKALAALNAELAELARSLSMEREAKLKAESTVGDLSASLATTQSERDSLRLTLDQTSATLTQTQAQLSAVQTAMIAEVERLQEQLAVLQHNQQQQQQQHAQAQAQQTQQVQQQEQQ